MKAYDISDNFRDREQVLEVTIQTGTNIGKLRTVVTGTEYGLDILKIVDEDFIFNLEDWEMEGCKVEYTGKDEEGEDWFRCIFTEPQGEHEYAAEVYHFNSMIVGINIISCERL